MNNNWFKRLHSILLLLLLLLEIDKSMKPWYTGCMRVNSYLEPNHFFIYNQTDKSLKVKQMTLPWNQWDLIKHNEKFLFWISKVEKLQIKAEDGKWSSSEYMVGLLSLPEQSHLATVLRSLNSVPNYLGDTGRNSRLS